MHLITATVGLRMDEDECSFGSETILEARAFINNLISLFAIDQRRQAGKTEESSEPARKQDDTNTQAEYQMGR